MWCVVGYALREAILTSVGWGIPLYPKPQIPLAHPQKKSLKSEALFGGVKRTVAEEDPLLPAQSGGHVDTSRIQSG